MDTIKELQTKLTIIFLGLLFGQVAFGGVVVFALMPAATDYPNREIFLVVSSVLLLSAIAGGIAITGKRLKALRAMPLEAVSAPYLSLSIIRFALVEMSVMFSIAVLLLTGDTLFLIFAGVGLAWFGYCFLRKARSKKNWPFQEISSRFRISVIIIRFDTAILVNIFL